jgi:hypothetical protein
VEISCRADGILIGGTSYPLDPDLRHEPHSHGNERDVWAAALIRSIDFGTEKVRRVAVRRVTLDIDFEESCD